MTNDTTLPARRTRLAPISSFLLLLFSCLVAFGAPVDLLQRYPTTLVVGDANPDRARSWQITGDDIYQVSSFHLHVGKELRVEMGTADLAIGHCSDGAVWAVLIPRDGGTLTRDYTNQEPISHIWLRFHPKEIDSLFPPEAVSADGTTNLLARILLIADSKMTSSWHAGGGAMIPEPKDLIVDVDTKTGLRRFFVVDQQSQIAKYVDDFSHQPVKMPLPPPTDAAGATFDQLWETFDRDYPMFVLRPEVDWAKLREEYRPRALASKSDLEFAGICADMLKQLRDLHIWMTISGENIPVFNRPRTANSNPSAHAFILGDLEDSGRVQWTVTDDKIGFIAIYGWDETRVVGQFDQALEQMRDTRGLIVDVRLNGGGSEDLALKVAGRFLEREFIYAYSQYRDGPNHTNLTQRLERKAAPRGPWRYNRPVLLLIGQKCMSSNESFIGMMTGDPEVTTMGDHSCGSSGNPEAIHLPLDITVSVPQWIDYLPDGTALDERGFRPQIHFEPTAESFKGDRDDLLSAALERLRKLPLPGQPIPGPVCVPKIEPLPDHSAEVNEEAQDSSRPRIISVTPTNGAESVSPSIDLRIQFDRPMDPLSLKLDWESGGFLSCEFPSYDTNKCEFTIPVRLSPGKLHQIVLNKPEFGYDGLKQSRILEPNDGFQSMDRQMAGVFVWRFNTREVSPPVNGKIPRVIRISPKLGSRTPLLTFVEIQFDQPMAAPDESPPYLPESFATAPELVRHVEYNAKSHTFRLPILLPANKTVTFKLCGFRNEEEIPALPIKISYSTRTDETAVIKPEQLNRNGQMTHLVRLLDSMRQQRLKLTSLSEHVRSLSLAQKEGLFISLESHSASFKWQNPGMFYGDVSDEMHQWAFRAGSDGQNWWFHRQLHDSTNLVTCPVSEMHDAEVSFCDPFSLSCNSADTAARTMGLKYAGVTNLRSAAFDVIESWKIDTSPALTSGRLIQWQIDSRSHQLTGITQYTASGVQYDHFMYDTLNQQLPIEAFAPPKIRGLNPIPPEPLDEDYTNRYVRIRDGSNGGISLYWGKKGPKGSSGAGLGN